jgi:hypothetical protein
MVGLPRIAPSDVALPDRPLRPSSEDFPRWADRVRITGSGGGGGHGPVAQASQRCQSAKVNEPTYRTSALFGRPRNC